MEWFAGFGFGIVVSYIIDCFTNKNKHDLTVFEYKKAKGNLHLTCRKNCYKIISKIIINNKFKYYDY